MQDSNAPLAAARETRSARRRTVLLLVCALAALCLAIAFWPTGEPTAPASQPPATREVEPATPDTARVASAPQRDVASPVTEERDDRPPDDATTLRIEFDAFD